MEPEKEAEGARSRADASLLRLAETRRSLTCDRPHDHDSTAVLSYSPGKRRLELQEKRPAVPARWFKNPQGQRKSGTPESRQPKK